MRLQPKVQRDAKCAETEERFAAVAHRHSYMSFSIKHYQDILYIWRFGFEESPMEFVMWIKHGDFMPEGIRVIHLSGMT